MMDSEGSGSESLFGMVGNIDSADKDERLKMLRDEESKLETLLLQLSSDGADESALESITNKLCELGEQIDALSERNVTDSTVEKSPPKEISLADQLAAAVLNWVATTLMTFSA